MTSSSAPSWRECDAAGLGSAFATRVTITARCQLQLEGHGAGESSSGRGGLKWQCYLEPGSGRCAVHRADRPAVQDN